LQCKLEGHTAPVYAFAWSRDGKTLATGSADATVRLWEMPSGSPLATYKGHTALVGAVTWMPDGKSLASASYDKTVRVWKAPDKKPAAGKKAEEEKSSAATGDASAETKSASDAGKKDTTKKAVGKKDAKDPNDPLIQEFKGHTAAVTLLAAPSAAKLLASGSSDKTLKIWNLTSNKQTASIDISYPVLAAAFSPDDKVLGSSGADEGLNFWNPGTGKLIKSTVKTNSSSSITALAWSPNGSLIAVGRSGHSLQLWDIQAEKAVHNLTAMAPVMTATWTPSGQTVSAGCQDRTVRFWSVAKGELVGHLIAEEGQVAAVSADGHFKAEPGIEAELFYVAQTDKSQETLSITDFTAKSKWKNNPAQAAVIGK
jgi:WD40 repeat protein